MMLDAPLAPEAEANERSQATPRASLAIMDGDMHPAPRSLADLKPYMSACWWEVLATYGSRRRHGMLGYEPYPKSAPRAARRDAWPEDGGPPGSNLDLIRKQYLDHYGIEAAMMGPLGVSGQGELNPDLRSALASAINDWQREHFTRPEPRLRSGIVVPDDDAEASVREIERCAPDPAYAHVFMLTRSLEPAGNRRYWPIYGAAARHGLPVALHVFGASGHPHSGGGWPSYYVEEGAAHCTSCQSVVTSLVIEGVFERFPALKVVLVEGGFAWLAPLAWRLDKLYARLRSEVPHLKRRPSDYIREHVWVTTQPMEEPRERRQLADMMEWIGWDRLIFSSDYPHWDFDDPFRAFPTAVPRDRARQILTANAKAVYRLG
ncbi:MAG: amidohydrolase [Hyphomicrobiaceae bacterium]|nr:amidohydrolase [Hyphomicrobiaceae bacterium]